MKPTSKKVLTVLVSPINNVVIRFKSTDARLDSSFLRFDPCPLNKLKPKVPTEQLGFGRHFTDHMLAVEWRQGVGWNKPVIKPFQNLNIHPGAKVLHYAQELYEGMKVYRGVDGRIRMFRPELNMSRMNVTANRACLPSFDSQHLLECIRRLVEVDSNWVPHSPSSSLYIRPTMIGTEPTIGLAPSNRALLYVIMSPVGSYFSSTTFKPVNLLCDPQFVRAWPGGSGATKMGSNYAPTLSVQKSAEEVGCDQVLWLQGEDQEVTEVGAMNIFILLRTKSGLELVTPPLDAGVILPGITRRSILELASSWGGMTVSERRVTLPELLDFHAEGRLLEMFGSGTAAVVSPVGGLFYQGRMHKIPTPSEGVANRANKEINDIYYGVKRHPWAVDIEHSFVDQELNHDEDNLRAVKSS